MPELHAANISKKSVWNMTSSQTSNDLILLMTICITRCATGTPSRSTILIITRRATLCTRWSIWRELILNTCKCTVIWTIRLCFISWGVSVGLFWERTRSSRSEMPSRTCEGQRVQSICIMIGRKKMGLLSFLVSQSILLLQMLPSRRNLQQHNSQLRILNSIHLQLKSKWKRIMKTFSGE